MFYPTDLGREVKAVTITLKTRKSSVASGAAEG